MGAKSLAEVLDPKAYVFFVGRLSRQKGVFDLLEAMDSVPEGTVLVLATGKPDTPDIEIELRRALKSANDVRVDSGDARRPRFW